MRRKMKGREVSNSTYLQRFLLMGAVIFLLFTYQAQADITDVDIMPEMPTTSDAITIITYGAENWGGITIDDVNFAVDGTFLQLDIFVTLGNTPSGIFWSHSENVGILPEGVYELQVREFGWNSINKTYVLGSTYPIPPMSFEVVPEPATLLLFSLGFLQIHRIRSIKRIK